MWEFIAVLGRLVVLICIVPLLCWAAWKWMTANNEEQEGKK